MDASVFYLLVKNYTCLTEDECQELNKLRKDYPYSQIVNLLNARALQDLNHPDKEKFLHQAAVYSTERSVLKHIMTSPRSERIHAFEVPVEDIKVAEIEQELSREEEHEQLIDDAPAYEPDGSSLSGDALRDDLYRELEKLQRLKKEFAVVAEEFQKSAITEPVIKKKLTSEPETNPLIQEIKSSRKKLKIDNPKQKEQNEIIDQFIKVKPSIPKVTSTETTSDLAEDSAMLGDNAVSETLVELLIRQGKKDKAIEVLKKLIWKFPQKKAYFAAQIDSLKN